MIDYLNTNKGTGLMKAYNRVMAGQRSVHASQCFKEGFIGVDYGMDIDFTGRLPKSWRFLIEL